MDVNRIPTGMMEPLRLPSLKRILLERFVDLNIHIPLAKPVGDLIDQSGCKLTELYLDETILGPVGTVDFMDDILDLILVSVTCLSFRLWAPGVPTTTHSSENSHGVSPLRETQTSPSHVQNPILI
jgi:hypothetical protein